ncbi:ABC transporter ATP-binding protein [Sinomonas soli]
MATPTDVPLLIADSVGKEVAGEPLLGPVSFSVGAGECVAVTGPDGSGKTTLLRLILGRDTPTTGTLTYGGPLARRQRTHIGSALGAPPFYEDLTIEEHLALLTFSWGGEAATGRFAPVLEALRLTGILHRFPAELSSGERQAAGITFALVRPASLLVLDEPEQRLDAERRLALGPLLARRRDSGTAIVMASHDAGLVAAAAGATVALADR